jgi:hypothetical protein
MMALDDRDREILRAFSDDAAATLAFQGIRRSLNLHPEKLSRGLKRLEGAGVLQRTKDGYRLTEAGVAAVPPPPQAAAERLTVMDTMVGPTAPAEAFVEQLKMKWFSNLRWVGFTQAGGAVALRWMTEDGDKRLTATLDGGRLLIDVEGDLTGGLQDALAGAQSIYSHILRAASRAQHGGQAPAWAEEPGTQT